MIEEGYEKINAEALELQGILDEFEDDDDFWSSIGDIIGDDEPSQEEKKVPEAKEEKVE